MELSLFLKFLLFRRVMLILWCFYNLLGPLGGLWGLFWEAFGGHLGSLGVALGEVWGRPCEFLKASWAPWRPRCPQEPPRRPPEASQTPPEASRRPPRGTPEASKGPSRGPRNWTLSLLRAMLPPGPGGMREAIKSGHPLGGVRVRRVKR